jgi:hypothetical protein
MEKSEAKALVRKALEIYGTINKAAMATGIHPNTLHRYLNGKTSKPQEAKLARLRRAAKQSVLWDSSEAVVS